VKRWISCRLEFRGRSRAGAPMAPNRYTGLFFLDDATALAAGKEKDLDQHRRGGILY
jgi:hypothetical protein